MAPQHTPISGALIIGGSHAGLSAALTIYRTMHTVMIFDSQKPRNQWGTAIRSTPGFEGKSPEEYREASREELRKSGLVTFVNTQITHVERTEEGMFEASDATGQSWLGRKVLLATGMQDVFPDLTGYLENYSTRM
jgi:gliotoxin/aspirochlorine biosynthesis thioredoxin reductase